MLKEPESSPEYQAKPKLYSEEDRPNPAQEYNQYDRLRELIRPHFAIVFEESSNIENLLPEDQAFLIGSKYSRLVVSYTGHFKEDAETSYQELDKALADEDMYALFRTNPNDVDAVHIIHIIKGRPDKQSSWSIWPNLILFILTILSVLYTGTVIAIAEIGLDDPARAETMSSTISQLLLEMWRGWPYALSIMLILIAHEMGHYLMMRRHGLNTSLPYFIPAGLISPFGTYGATMIIAEPAKNRKAMLEIAAAGPIAGFILALPIVFIGLATSHLIPLTPGGFVEGNSLIYIFAKFMVFGQLLPNAEFDVLVNQLAWAGWTGLLLTAFNLIPVGMLDGGQILYSLFAYRARRGFWPVMIALLALSIIFWQLTWLILWILLYFFGRFYHIPHDDITALNPSRRWIAIACIVIFILSFPPVPLYINQAGTENLNTALQSGAMAVAALLVLPRWWKMRKLR
jgi:Zn-dependent protease